MADRTLRRTYAMLLCISRNHAVAATMVHATGLMALFLLLLHSQCPAGRTCCDLAVLAIDELPRMVQGQASLASSHPCTQPCLD
jgi:hypothetical protein